MLQLAQYLITKHKIKKNIKNFNEKLDGLSGKDLHQELHNNDTFELIDNILYELGTNSPLGCYSKNIINEVEDILNNTSLKLDPKTKEILDEIRKIIDNNIKYSKIKFKVDIIDENSFYHFINMLEDETLSKEGFENLFNGFIKNLKNNIKSNYLNDFFQILIQNKFYTNNHSLKILLLKQNGEITNGTRFDILMIKKYLIINDVIDISNFLDKFPQELNLVYELLLMDDISNELMNKLIQNTNIKQKEELFLKLNQRNFYNKTIILNKIKELIIFEKQILTYK